MDRHPGSRRCHPVCHVADHQPQSHVPLPAMHGGPLASHALHQAILVLKDHPVIHPSMAVTQAPSGSALPIPDFEPSIQPAAMSVHKPVDSAGSPDFWCSGMCCRERRHCNNEAEMLLRQDQLLERSASFHMFIASVRIVTCVFRYQFAFRPQWSLGHVLMRRAHWHS